MPKPLKPLQLKSPRSGAQSGASSDDESQSTASAVDMSWPLLGERSSRKATGGVPRLNQDELDARKMLGQRKAPLKTPQVTVPGLSQKLSRGLARLSQKVQSENEAVVSLRVRLAEGRDSEPRAVPEFNRESRGVNAAKRPSFVEAPMPVPEVADAAVSAPRNVAPSDSVAHVFARLARGGRAESSPPETPRFAGRKK